MIRNYGVNFIKSPDEASVGDSDVSLQEATIDMTIDLQIHVQTQNCGTHLRFEIKDVYCLIRHTL